MKRVLVSLFLLVFTMGVQAQNTIGKAFDFDQLTNGDIYLDAGDPGFGDSSFTISTWVYFNEVSGDPAFLSNKSWSSGNNTGINIAIQSSGGQLDVNYKPSGSARNDVHVNYDFMNAWNHLAVVVDRSGEMIVYINGINKGSTDVSASVGVLDGDYSFKLGQDGSGVYGLDFKGALDELTIWNKALSEDEVRNYMCTQPDPNANALKLHVDFNDNITNNSTGNDLVLVNQTGSEYIKSGAFVGTESSYVYGADLSAESLEISTANGEGRVDNIEGALGVQLVWVPATSVLNSSSSEIPNTEGFWGVYPVFESSAPSKNIDFSLDYSSYPDAIGLGSDVRLIHKKSNEIDFSSIGLEFPLNNEIKSTGVKYSKLMQLASIQGLTCGLPSNLDVELTFPGAEFVWSGAGGTEWNVVMIEATENAAMETPVNVSDEMYNYPSLNAGVVYSAFVQEVCSGGQLGPWVGPYNFEEFCYSPENVQLKSIEGNQVILEWEMEEITELDLVWAPMTLDLQFGIVTPVDTNVHSLDNLQPNTSYHYILRTKCDEDFGPFYFTTENAYASIDKQDLSTIVVYPNPAKEVLFVDGQVEKIELINNLGELVFASTQSLNKVQLTNFKQGVYFVKLYKNNQTIVKKIIIVK